MCKLCSAKSCWEVLCASFLVQSMLQRYFCVNDLCLKLLCAKAFCAHCVVGAKDFSLTVRAFWRAEQQRWAEKNCEEMRKVDQCSDEMKAIEKNLLRWHVRRDRMRWEALGWGEMRWEEFTWFEMRWSVECEVQVWSVKCGVWRVFVWRCIAPGSRAGHVLGQQHCNRFAQSTHARAWLAHGACKFYRWERSFSITLRQLPPRLVRLLPFWAPHLLNAPSEWDMVIFFHSGLEWTSHMTLA